MKKWLWVCAAVVVAAGMLSPAWSAPRGEGFPFWKAEKFVEKAGLTEPQIKQLEEIWYNFRKAGIEIEARIKGARLNFDHLLLQDDVDTKQLESLAGQIAAARKDQIELSLKRTIEIRKVLSSAQWEECEKFKRGAARRIREGQAPRSPHSGRWGAAPPESPPEPKGD